MNKVEKLFLASLAAAALTLAFSSCNNDDDKTDGIDKQNAELEAVAKQYVGSTVNLTYSLLATGTQKLYEDLLALKTKMKGGASASQSEIDDICAEFLLARGYYEESEAFLFGAATDFGIDPHIDTWPLDLQGLADALSNKTQMANLDAENEDDAIAYAAGKLGQELLGFHGIEFVIFRDGKNREASAFNGNEGHATFKNTGVTGLEEIIYATAVAGDLRDRCWQMEVSWNENAPAEHAKRVEDLELPSRIQGNGYTYGQNFLAATKSGSTYATWIAAMRDLVNAGCMNICNEVANTKIGNPYSGEDPNYIESPYSQRSFYDFEDNMESIWNCMNGGRSESRDTGKSLMAFVQENNPSMASSINKAYEAAIAALKTCQALPGGFVNNTSAKEVGVAQAAINDLNTELSKLDQWLGTL